MDSAGLLRIPARQRSGVSLTKGHPAAVHVLTPPVHLPYTAVHLRTPIIHPVLPPYTLRTPAVHPWYTDRTPSIRTVSGRAGQKHCLNPPGRTDPWCTDQTVHLPYSVEPVHRSASSGRLGQKRCFSPPDPPTAARDTQMAYLLYTVGIPVTLVHSVRTAPNRGLFLIGPNEDGRLLPVVQRWPVREFLPFWSVWSLLVPSSLGPRRDSCPLWTTDVGVQHVQSGQNGEIGT